MTNKKMKELVTKEVTSKISAYKTENIAISCFAGLSAIVVTALLNMRTNKRVSTAVENINQLSEVYAENISQINDAIKSSNADRDKVMRDISDVLERQTSVFEKIDFVVNESTDDEGQTEENQNTEDSSQSDAE